MQAIIEVVVEIVEGCGFSAQDIAGFFTDPDCTDVGDFGVRVISAVVKQEIN